MASESEIELGTAIVVEVYKKTIIGSTTAVFVEGGWSVYPDSDPKRWMCFADIRPVYLEDCLCDGKLPDRWTGESDEEFQERSSKSSKPVERFKPENDEEYNDRLKKEVFANHWTICLHPVGFYDEDVEMALDVVTHLAPSAFSLHNIDGKWIAELYDATKVFRGEAEGPFNKIDAAATAICRAALDFVRAPGKVPK